MTVSAQPPNSDIANRIRAALAAWSGSDASIWSGLFSEQVVFGSPSTEWIGDRGWTAGKSEVLRRFERERTSFASLELIDILVDGSRATVLLRDGPRSVACQLEIDPEGLVSRLISFVVSPPGEMILPKIEGESPYGTGSVD